MSYYILCFIEFVFTDVIITHVIYATLRIRIVFL